MCVIFCICRQPETIVLRKVSCPTPPLLPPSPICCNEGVNSETKSWFRLISVGIRVLNAFKSQVLTPTVDLKPPPQDYSSLCHVLQIQKFVVHSKVKNGNDFKNNVNIMPIKATQELLLKVYLSISLINSLKIPYFNVSETTQFPGCFSVLCLPEFRGTCHRI